jgi:hypothetical protein
MNRGLIVLFFPVCAFLIVRISAMQSYKVFSDEMLLLSSGFYIVVAVITTLYAIRLLARKERYKNRPWTWACITSFFLSGFLVIGGSTTLFFYSDLKKLPVIPVHRMVPKNNSLVSFDDIVFDGNIGFDMTIPLEPFDSELSYMPQPEGTTIYISSCALPVADLNIIDGVLFEPTPDSITENTIYLGSAHNTIDVKKVLFKKIDEKHYYVDLLLKIDFSLEGVGRDATVRLPRFVAEVK